MQAPHSGQVHIAVAAGISLLRPRPYIYNSKLLMLSPHVWSHMWNHDSSRDACDDRGAIILLKTLSNVLADGERTEAVAL